MDSSKEHQALAGTTTSPVDEVGKLNSATSTPGYGTRETITNEPGSAQDGIEESGGGWFAYLKTRNFYIVLALGYVEVSQASVLKAVVNKLTM